MSLGDIRLEHDQTAAQLQVQKVSKQTWFHLSHINQLSLLFSCDLIFRPSQCMVLL